MTTIERLAEHYNESLEYFSADQIVICALQGSQNYQLDLPTSDVDTKLIVTPSFKDIALARKPVSTTHVRDNAEHVDFKDVRLYFETFRKQNLNFLEILFTPYKIINPDYAAQWDRLIQKREEIAHMNPFRAVKSMKGIALEKYHAMEHAYPSKVDVLAQYGYDGKQTHHLLRIEDYIERYISGEEYEKCLIPSPHKYEHLIAYKQQQIPLEVARIEAEKSLNHIINLADNFCNITSDKENSETGEFLKDVSYNIMKISVQKELWAK